MMQNINSPSYSGSKATNSHHFFILSNLSIIIHIYSYVLTSTINSTAVHQVVNPVQWRSLCYGFRTHISHLVRPKPFRNLACFTILIMQLLICLLIHTACDSWCTILGDVLRSSFILTLLWLHHVPSTTPNQLNPLKTVVHSTSNVVWSTFKQ